MTFDEAMEIIEAVSEIVTESEDYKLSVQVTRNPFTNDHAPKLALYTEGMVITATIDTIRPREEDDVPGEVEADPEELN